MLYCADCQRITQGDCPHCGRKAGKLREIRENDPVLIYRGNFIRSSMVEPLLEDNKIPYSKTGALGAGLAMKTGNFLETYSFFVPYGAYEDALRVIAAVFGDDADIMNDLVVTGIDIDALLSEEDDKNEN